MNTSVAERREPVSRLPDRPARTPAGDAFSDLVIRIIRIGALLTAAGDELARPTGQTSARWLVMAAVEERPATVARVARVLGLTRQSVQRVADLLVDDGLADYEDNPGHRRAKLLRLTPGGLRTLRTIQEAQRTWADELGARMGVADLRRATKVLDRLLPVLMEHRHGAGDRRRNG
jgi:DNA-binding MarR family transcriptional regulator